MISREEDLTSGPRIRLDHSRAFVYQSFNKVRKGTENTSDKEIRREMKNAPLTSLSKRAIYLTRVKGLTRPIPTI